MARRVTEFLAADEGVGAAKVFTHAARLLAIARLYQQIAPPAVSEGSRVVNYKSAMVVIHANNGAVASKLRQMPASLAEKFRAHGVACSGVQVKVHNAREMMATPYRACVKPLAMGTCAQLTALSDSLPPSALRRALEALVERAAKRE